MSEQELVSEIEEVEVAAAEATEESAAIEQQAEEATEAVAVAEAAAEAAEEVDALEEFKSKLRRQPGDWYVVHTYSGYENKVKTGSRPASRTWKLKMKSSRFRFPWRPWLSSRTP